MANQVVILAAGQGKRMHSSLPKVLHKIGGVALLQHVLETAQSVSNKKPIVVFGFQGARIQTAMASHTIEWVQQTEQLGTGHAVQQALPFIDADDRVLILYGDVPLISRETLQELISSTPKEALGMLVAELAAPTGYGRIQRDTNGDIVGVIEERDANEHEKKITEINPGIYWVKASHLKKWLPKLSNRNQQQEYYLTDMIAYAVMDGVPIHAVSPKEVEEIFGVNDCVQLAMLERYYQLNQARMCMLQGVTLLDPKRFDVRGKLKVDVDTVIDVNVIFEGNVTIGKNCHIGSHVFLRDVTLADHVEIKAYSHIEGATIAAHCIVGPFARIRPGSALQEAVHIGNFVEIKNSQVDKNSKINHLSYIGDSEIGQRVNVGAGTITCNYDGANKHKTIIGDDVHIGSDTQLVAPIAVGNGATIAAGSTVVKDVAPNGLTLTHSLNQRVLKDWRRSPKK